MTNFNELTNDFELVVLIACLVVGYLIKHSFNLVPNKYIPTILAILGACLNATVTGVSIAAVVYGALTGLTSTGMHQAFTKFIENADKKED